MKQKRAERISFGFKGQVTVFMIVGILILFAFLFLILLSSSLTKESLEQSKEGVLTKLFSQQGLKIFLDDCLQGTIKQGIIEIGKSGKLWSEEGGITSFRAGKNGLLTDDGQRVYFGITDEEEGMYPCDGKSCYLYPSTAVGFGVLNWRANTFESELKRYVAAKIESCVQEYAESDIDERSRVELIHEEAKVEVELRDDSAKVEGTYPVKFTLGEEVLFEQTEFSGAYTTTIKQLLDAAVTFPLEMDQKYVDFVYEENTLKAPSFPYASSLDAEGNEVQSQRDTRGEKFNLLGLTLESKKENGNTIYEVKQINPSAAISVIPGENYVFRVARQNRPPALSYISQCPTEGYDYLLVLKFDQNNQPVGFVEGLGWENFKVKAGDPDEETTLVTSFVNGDEAELRDAVLNNGFFNSNPIPEIPGKIIVTVKDSFGKADSQEVIIMTQEKDEPEVQIKNKFMAADPVAPVVLSPEEPYCLEIDEEENGEVLQYSFGETILNNLKKCNDENYFNRLDINGFYNEGLDSSLTFFKAERTERQALDNPACSYEYEKTIPITVQQCVHEDNNDYLYPYIATSVPKYQSLKEMYKYDSKGTLDNDRNNPFQARNGCCTPEGNFKNNGDSCLAEGVEILGCFNNEFYLEKAVPTCNGQRGNVCGGEISSVPYVEGVNTCGIKNKPGCNQEIADKCQEKKAWGVEEGVWCYSNVYRMDSGCKFSCEKPTFSNYYLGEMGGNSIVDDTGMVENLPEKKYKDDFSLSLFACGCKQEHVTNNRACDANYDQIFEGVCKSALFGYYCDEP